MKRLFFVFALLITLLACGQTRHSTGVILGDPIGTSGDPVTGKAGQIYWNQTLLKFRKHNGTAWSDLTVATVPTLQDVTDTGATSTNSIGIVGTGSNYFNVSNTSTSRNSYLYSDNLQFSRDGFSLTLQTPTLTGNNTITWQDGSGTVAFLDQIVGDPNIVETIVNPLDISFGTKIKPIGTSDGFYVDGTENKSTGYLVKSNNNTGSGHYVGYTAEGYGATAFQKGFSLAWFGDAYYETYLRGNTGLFANGDLKFIGGKNTSDMSFRLGKNATPSLQQADTDEVLTLAANRTVTFPQLTNSLITSGGNQSPVTLGYANANFAAAPLDDAYGVAWNGDTTNSASRNAIYDKIEAVILAGGGESTTVSDTAEIDLTLTGNDITASLIAASIDETKLDFSVNASLDLADTAIQTEVDGSVTNEIQTIDVSSLVGTVLNLSLSNDGQATKTIELSSLQDGIGTDDQTASEVVSTPSGNLAAANVQAALNELQSDIDTRSVGAHTVDTKLTDEEVQDKVGAMVTTTNTETLITVTYQDATGDIDFVVDNNLANYSNATSNFSVGAHTTDTNTLGPDGDKGDITVGGSGTTLQIDTGAVGTLEIANGTVSETDLNTSVNLSLDKADTALQSFTEVDGSVSNELQTFDIATLSGNNLQLSLTQDAATAVVDLTPLKDGTGTDDQTGAEVLLTGYVKAVSASAIAATDNVNVGLGKLEKSLEDALAGGVTSVAGKTGVVTLVEADITDLAHTVDTDDQTATQVPSTPSGNLVASNVQAALNELQSDIDTRSVGSHTVDTKLSQEEVQDFVGSMVTANTETLIAVTYDDIGNQFDFVVDNNLANYSNATSNFSTGAHTVDKLGADGDKGEITVGGSGTTLTIDNSVITSAKIFDGTIDELDLDTSVNLSLDKADTALQTEVDGSVTNEIQQIDVASLVGTDLHLSLSSDGVADKTISLAGFSQGAHTVDTKLTQEEVQDFVGSMVTGNTETLIAVTYDDVGNQYDFVVDNNLANYSNATSNFSIGTHTVDKLGADGDKGDITVGSAGTTLTIDNSVITSAKIFNGTIDELDLDTSVNASLDLADNSVQLTGSQTITGGKTFTVAGTAMTLNNNGVYNSIYGNNNSGGNLFYGNNTLTGAGIVLNGTTPSTGLLYVGQNNGANTFTVSKFGDVIANQFITTGGTGSQFVKGNGILDSNTYINTSFSNDVDLATSFGESWINSTGTFAAATNFITIGDNGGNGSSTTISIDDPSEMITLTAADIIATGNLTAQQFIKSGGTNQQQLLAGGSVRTMPKVYTALISQSGTAAPTVTVLENTLGGTITWSRSTTGTYLGTLTGVFTLDKTVGFIQHNQNGSYAFGTDTVWYSLGRNDANSVKIIVTNQSGTAVDSSLKKASIEIRVYP